MLQSARRAAPGRRWVGARGRRADGSFGFKAARRERETAKNRTSTPKCEQLQKSELQSLSGRGERVVGPLPRPLTLVGVWRCCEGTEGASAEPKSSLCCGGCARCLSPSPARDPSRASCPLPVRRQPRAQPPGGGAPVAEPARLRAGLLLPDWLAVPRRPAEGRAHVTAARCRRGPLEGVSVQPRRLASGSWAAAAPPGGSSARGCRRGCGVTRA